MTEVFYTADAYNKESDQRVGGIPDHFRSPESLAEWVQKYRKKRAMIITSLKELN